MKTLSLFSVALLVGGLVAISSLSSFRQEKNEKTKNATDHTYFKFDNFALPEEGNLESEEYWMVIDNPGSTSPCPSGTSAPCVIRIENVEAGIEESDLPNVRVEKLINYLKNQASAVDFVEEPGNYIFQRP